jgi:apolipoprotein D and lipocalin family protein
MLSLKKYFLLSGLLLLSACTGIPEGIAPVDNFTLDRYLGTWYEIARLDHSFERGLQKVSANYSLNEDGSVEVLNSGENLQSGELETATGLARFVANPDTAHLKVSFFGPFYGSYIVFELDEDNYQYAFVSGYNTKYLWLLSRTKQVSPQLKARFLDEASELGFPVDEIIWVEQ